MLLKLKSFRLLTLVILAISANALATQSDDNKILLKSFHQYGITHCDSFIIKESALKGNWYYNISTNKDDLDKNVSEVSVVQILGTKGDTIKIDCSYTQTPDACFLHKRSISTFSGPCKDNIDLNYWYLQKPLPTQDYDVYKNQGGVTLLAKEISVGNFKACILEYERRAKGKRG